MGWNDRLPEDPFIPSAEYYRDRDDYEAWLEYVEARLQEESTGLSSQNVDPATLTSKPQQEAPDRQGMLARLWATIIGPRARKEDADLPF
jgi:hypothetical protein